MFSPDLNTLGSTRNQTQGQYVGMYYQCQYFITDTAKDWGLLVRKQNSRDRTEIVSDENVGAQNIATVQQNWNPYQGSSDHLNPVGAIQCDNLINGYLAH